MSKDSSKPKLTLVPNATPFSEAGKYSCEVMRSFIQHRFDYIASPTDPWLSIYLFPQESFINVRRFKSTTEKLLEQGTNLNSIIAFCIEYALRETYHDQIPSIKQAIELREIFDRQSSSVPGLVMEILYHFQNNFPLAFKTDGHKKNVQLKRDVLEELSTSATAMGINNYELANLCVYSTLSQSEGTIASHVQKMEIEMKEFLDKLQIRNRALKAMFKEFDIK